MKFLVLVFILLLELYIEAYELLYPCMACMKTLEILSQEYPRFEANVANTSKINYLQFLSWLQTVNTSGICPPLSTKRVSFPCVWYQGGQCKQFYSAQTDGIDDWSLNNPFARAFKVSLVSQVKPSLQQQSENIERIYSDQWCLDLVQELKASVQLPSALQNGCTYSQVLYRQNMLNGNLGPLLTEQQKHKLVKEHPELDDHDSPNSTTWSIQRVPTFISRCSPRLMCNCLLSKKTIRPYCPVLDTNIPASACLQFGNNSKLIATQAAAEAQRTKDLNVLGDKADQLVEHMNDPP